MGIGEILPAQADIDEDTSGASEKTGGLPDIPGNARNHANKVGQGHRGDDALIFRDYTVREGEPARPRVDCHQLVIESKMPHRHKVLQIRHETAVAGTSEMSNVMNLGSARRERTSEDFF